MSRESLRVGKRGTVVLPAKLRRQFGMEEGAMIIAEALADGILLRPAAVVPVEIYSDARRAEFLLNNAVGPDEYGWALQEVRRMGLDPDAIPHDPPLG
jgi:AbrB family looped-hinge helix DNA binding protein